MHGSKVQFPTVLRQRARGGAGEETMNILKNLLVSLAVSMLISSTVLAGHYGECLIRCGFQADIENKISPQEQFQDQELDLKLKIAYGVFGIAAVAVGISSMKQNDSCAVLSGLSLASIGVVTLIVVKF
jgi:hypothetical protein